MNGSKSENKGKLAICGAERYRMLLEELAARTGWWTGQLKVYRKSN